jgi:hydrogenase/urease accessory protein HupE
MPEAVYALCALTSAVCAILLVRAYRRNRVRLLFWSAFCFIALAASSVLVFVDLIVVPETDLAIPRSLIALTGLGGLLFALIWDTR